MESSPSSPAEERNTTEPALKHNKTVHTEWKRLFAEQHMDCSGFKRSTVIRFTVETQRNQSSWLKLVIWGASTPVKFWLNQISPWLWPVKLVWLQTSELSNQVQDLVGELVLVYLQTNHGGLVDRGSTHSWNQIRSDLIQLQHCCTNVASKASDSPNVAGDCIKLIMMSSLVQLARATWLYSLMVAPPPVCFVQLLIFAHMWLCF